MPKVVLMRSKLHLCQIALNFLVIICMGISFSGCVDVSKSIADFIIIQLLILNTILLIGGFAYLIWKLNSNK